MPFPKEIRATSVHAKEVLKEINDRPHLLVRVDITGGFFPQRAVEPFVRIIGGDRKASQSWLADVSEDNRTLSGYFPVDLPNRGVLEFGYGKEVTGRLKFSLSQKAIGRLDRKRIPKEAIEVSRAYLEKKR